MKDYIGKLQKLIEDYELIHLNLFNSLKNSCISWQDGNSLLFDEKMQLEKRESKTFEKMAMARKTYYDMVFSKYSTLGNIIECNINAYAALINGVNSCIETANGIIDKVNSVGYDVSYASGKVASSLAKLEQVKTDLMKTYKIIMEAENQIGAYITGLTHMKIDDFDFSFKTVSYDKDCIVDMINIGKDIEKIREYDEEEFKMIEVLFDTLVAAHDEYKSDTNSIVDDVGKMKVEAKVLNKKRAQYVDILLKTIENYKKAVTGTLKIMNGEM